MYDNKNFVYDSAGRRYIIKNGTICKDVSVSDTSTENYELLLIKQPNRQDSRDMTIFKYRGGKAYHIHSKDWNKTLNIAKLSDNYTDLSVYYVSVMEDQEREAPAVFEYGEMYYML